MCGIVGILAHDKEVDKVSLWKAVKALEHRGPDGEGVYISPDKMVGLGHTRLAIIGLENGSQPIANEDGQVQIVVNGEFYDFERIRRELEVLGHCFNTTSDAEIALHLYEEYGIDCLEHLRGEFAFIIWDGRIKRLFAARDRFGIKPLNYAFKDGALYLASEAKAIFAAGIEAAWDSESFFHAASMQYILPHRTLFSGVYQLLPGHFLIAENGTTKSVCYWDLDYSADNGNSHCIDESALIASFGEKLREAVRLRLRADIPICCHLSGGLDSSAILALAAQECGTPLKAFSVSFEEKSYDELVIAQEMADNANVQLHPILLSQKDLIKSLPEAVYYSEGLAVNGHLPAKFLLHREIKKAGYKVVLTGEGSDEVLAGYAHLRSDLYKEQGKGDLIAHLAATNAASRGIMLQHGKTLNLEAVKTRLGYIPTFLEAKGSLGYKLYAMLTDEFTARFASKDSYDELLACFDVVGQLRGRQHVYQSLYLWTKTALANYILRTLGDGTEMANAVEGRLPFLDHHLFEFIRTLPLSLKIRDTVEKYVLREAVRPLVTSTIYQRQKHPFVAPPISLFSDPAADELVQDTLRSSTFSTLPFFSQSRLLALLDNLPTMSPEDRAATDPVLMTALSAACLQERLISRR